MLLWNWRTGEEEPLLGDGVLGTEASADDDGDGARARGGSVAIRDLASEDVLYEQSDQAAYVLAGHDDGSEADEGSMSPTRVLHIARASGRVLWSWSWPDACDQYPRPRGRRLLFAQRAPEFGARPDRARGERERPRRDVSVHLRPRPELGDQSAEARRTHRVDSRRRALGFLARHLG